MAPPDGTPLRDRQGRLIPEPGGIALGVEAKRNGTWHDARFPGDGRRNEARVTCHIQTRSKADFAFCFRDHVQTRKSPPRHD